MADSAFYVLWILAFSALQVISLSWGEIKRLKENMSAIEAVLLDAEESRIILEEARNLLDGFKYDGSAGWKLCRFFSSSNPLVFCFRIGAYWHRLKKMRERYDKILAEMRVRRNRWRVTSVGMIKSSRSVSLRAFAMQCYRRIIFNHTFNVTDFFFDAWKLIGHPAKQIVYLVACIAGVCVDPFFLYIPFLSYTKMCLGINRELWKVAVALRTVADFFTASMLLPQLSRCMSSIKSILLMCLKYLVLAPIPQILFSEKFILKTLRGYSFWNLSVFCQYGIRLVLILQACEQLKRRLSVRTLVWFIAPVYLFFYLLVSHVIGAFWYYLSIKRQLSCWNYTCNINTGCIFHCDGTTRSTLNSTLYNQFCPVNPLNAAVFDYGIYLDALQSRIVEEEGVLKKCLRCFFWGLRNLSSFASNLHTSTNEGETFFAIIISAVALILLIYIIGNIQRYSELESARSERIVYKMELIKELTECLAVFHNLDNCTKKLIVEHIQEALENGCKNFNLGRLRINHFRHFFYDVTIELSVLEDLHLLEEWVFNGQPDNLRKAKKWLSDNNIPHDQNNILFYLTCRLKDDEDVNLTSVLSVLPDESKWMTMRDFYFDTLKKVPGLQSIDEKWFKSMSSRLKPVIYPEASYIFRQGEPLHFIIFITNGVACSSTTVTHADGVSGSTCFLQKGDFFGAELIKWKLESHFLGVSGSSKSLENGDFFGVSGSSKSLENGDFFGEELVQWNLDKRRELEWELKVGRIPHSTADVKSHTQVEAFVLTIEDLNNWKSIEDLSNWTYTSQVGALSDFPVPTSKWWRIVRKLMLVTVLCKITAASATEGVDSSSQTEEDGVDSSSQTEEDDSVPLWQKGN